MHLTGIFTAAMMATASTATIIRNLNRSPIPGYPLGTSCLSDKQATFLAEKFRLILGSTDRQVANITAQTLIADKYSELSDSVNILAGRPLGTTVRPTKAEYISGVVNTPAVNIVTTKVLHDCENLIWSWRATGIGSDTYPVRGINSFVVAPYTGQFQSVELEFNSIAWGTDIGWTCTPPPK